jgi:ribonuclease-3
MKKQNASCEQLESRLGYTFSDKSLLKAALTHRSIRGKNNERLEFLGDALLNFIIASELYESYTTAKEGELSRRRANLVNGDVLADIARNFNLGDCLYLGTSELRSGGGARKSILANALEALIGAIYLDRGIEACKICLLEWYGDHLKHPLKSNLKDPKSELQEYLQANKLPLPDYYILKTEGEAHNSVFYVECRVAHLPYSAQGSGTSRRRAEQTAASHFLTLLKKNPIKPGLNRHEL